MPPLLGSHPSLVCVLLLGGMNQRAVSQGTCPCCPLAEVRGTESSSGRACDHRWIGTDGDGQGRTGTDGDASDGSASVCESARGFLRGLIPSILPFVAPTSSLSEGFHRACGPPRTSFP